MVSFSVEASKAFGPRAIGYRANPDNPDGEFELHFLAETIKDHPGREAKLVVGYNSDYGRYWVRVFDLTTGEYASAPETTLCSDPPRACSPS